MTKEKESITDTNILYTNKLFLIVEDDDYNYILAHELITSKKGNVIRASNGKEAVEIFYSTPNIDIILMDIKLPILSGCDATREIRIISKNIPIIALTAYAIAEYNNMFVDCGFTDYVAKPISNNILFKKIEKHLHLS